MWQRVNTVPVQNLNVKSHLDNLGVDVMIILKCIERKHDGRMCTGLAQNRDQWLATVTRKINFGIT